MNETTDLPNDYCDDCDVVVFAPVLGIPFGFIFVAGALTTIHGITANQAYWFCSKYMKQAQDLEGLVLQKRVKVDEVDEDETEVYEDETEHATSERVKVNKNEKHELLVQCEVDDGRFLQRSFYLKRDLYDKFEQGQKDPKLLMHFPGFPRSAQLRKEMEWAVEQQSKHSYQRETFWDPGMADVVLGLVHMFAAVLIFSAPFLVSSIKGRLSTPGAVVWPVVLFLWSASPFLLYRFCGKHGLCWWEYGRLSMLYADWKDAPANDEETVRQTSTDSPTGETTGTGCGSVGIC